MNDLSTIETEELIARIDRAREQRRMSDGLITSALAPGADEPSWQLTGEARADILRRLEHARARLHVHSEIFGRDGQVSFWVIAIQADDTEHRCVVALAGPTVGAFIAQGGLRRIEVTLHSSGAIPSLSLPIALTPGFYDELTRRHRSHLDPLNVMSEQVAALAQLLAPDFVTRPSNHPVPQLISVCSVLSPELGRSLADLEASFRSAAGGSIIVKANT